MSDATGPSAPGPDAPLPQSELGAGALVTRVLDLIGRAHSIADFRLENAQPVLGLPLETTRPGVWRQLARLTPDWNYLLQYDETPVTGPALVLDFFSDARVTPAMSGICEVEFDSVGASLEATGYRRQTRYGEHGEVVDHRFTRDQLTATVVTGNESDQAARECVRSITVR